MTAPGGGQSLDALFWELSYRTDGLDAGEAKVRASAKAVETELDRTRRKAEGIGAGLKATGDGFTAMGQRLDLLSRGLQHAGTRAESLRQLTHVEREINAALKNSNLSLTQRIDLETTLKGVQSSILAGKRAIDEARITAALRTGNITMRERIALQGKLNALQAQGAATGIASAAGGAGRGGGGGLLGRFGISGGLRGLGSGVAGGLVGGGLVGLGIGVVTGIGREADESAAAFDRFEAAMRKLEATSKLTGVPLAEITALADDLQERLNLSSAEAAEASQQILKLASRAEQTGRAGEVLTAWLDLAAAQGLNLAESIQTIQTTLIGQDEGLNRLGLSNPAQIYEAWARAADRSVSSMNEAEKAQAIMNAVVESGAKVQGEYEDRLSSSAGQADQAARAAEKLRTEVGAISQPVRDAGNAFKEWGLGLIADGIKAVREQMQGLARAPVSIEQAFRNQFGLPGANNRPAAPDAGVLPELVASGRTLDDLDEEVGLLLAAEKAGFKVTDHAQRRRDVAEELLAITREQTQSDEDRAAAAGLLTGLREREKKAADEAAKAAEKAAKDAEAAAEKRATLLDNYQGQLAALSDTALDDIELQLKRMEEQAEEVFGTERPEEFGRIIAGLRAKIAAARVLEPLVEGLDAIEAQVERMESMFREGAVSTPATQDELFGTVEAAEAQVRAARAVRDATAEESDERRAANEQLERAERAYLRLIQLISRAGDDESERSKELRKQAELIRQQADAIEDAGRGAIQLAEAFGFVDATTARALENLLTIGTKLPGLVNEIQKLGAGGGSIGAVFGAALPVAGALAGLVSSAFGESAAEKATREALRQTKDALDRLTKAIGDFNVSITGTQITGVRAALAPGGADLAFGERALNRHFVERRLEAQGLSIADLEAVAAEFGIAVDYTAEGIALMRDALAEVEFAQFADDMKGSFQAMQTEFELFDIDDPVKQLEALRKASKQSGSPALAGFAEFDLSTAEGRAAAEKFIQDTFGKLKDGTFAKDPSLIGDLTPQEVLDFLLRSEGLIDEANRRAEEGDGGETRSLQISRSVTETTALRLDAGIGSLNARADETNRILRLIESHTGRLVGGGAIQPPPVPTGPSAGVTSVNGEPAVLIESLTIPVSVTAPAGADPTLAGALIGQAVVDQAIPHINEALGRATRKRAQLAGNVKLA